MSRPNRAKYLTRIQSNSIIRPMVVTFYTSLGLIYYITQKLFYYSVPERGKQSTNRQVESPRTNKKLSFVRRSRFYPLSRFDVDFQITKILKKCPQSKFWKSTPIPFLVRARRRFSESFSFQRCLWAEKLETRKRPITTDSLKNTTLFGYQNITRRTLLMVALMHGE